MGLFDLSLMKNSLFYLNIPLYMLYNSYSYDEVFLILSLLTYTCSKACSDFLMLSVLSTNIDVSHGKGYGTILMSSKTELK